MKYKIIDNGKVIAKFEFEHDRDVCFDLLDNDNNMIKEDEK